MSSLTWLLHSNRTTTSRFGDLDSYVHHEIILRIVRLKTPHAAARTDAWAVGGKSLHAPYYTTYPEPEIGG